MCVWFHGFYVLSCIVPSCCHMCWCCLVCACRNVGLEGLLLLYVLVSVLVYSWCGDVLHVLLGVWSDAFVGYGLCVGSYGSISCYGFCYGRIN